MKKIGAWLIVILLLAFGFLLSAKAFAQSYLLGMIDVKFCNYDQTNKELDLVSKAGDILPLCVEFTNKSTAPITINIDFLDSIITADSIKNRACNAADRPKTEFGNFILPYKSELILSPQKTIQQKYSMKYPIGFSGLSHGCLAYNIVWWDITDSETFTVRIRSTKYIDVFVSDTKAIQTINLSQSPILTKVDDEYIISFWIANKGNIEEKLHITSVLSNIFGYQKEFTFDTIIPANTWVILTTPTFIMPVYWGPYRFKNKISYTPQFNFNITNGTHPSKIYSGGIRNTLTLLFVWTRQSWVVIIILLLIIYSIFRPLRRSPNPATNEQNPITEKSQVTQQPGI